MVVEYYNSIIRQTEPASEPINLDEIKEQLRIEPSFTFDDQLLYDYSIAARERCEDYANRFFAESNFIVLFDQFPNDTKMKLPFPDSVVNSITYIDSDNVEQALTGYTYDGDFQEVYLSNNFPVGTNVKISITSGKIYERAKRAMLLYVADFYETRTAEKSEPNYAAESLLYPLRVEIGA